MQVPSNLFLNKIGKPAVYLPTCMIVWGMISATTAACQSYGGLVACRFFLGFVEAAYFIRSVSSPSPSTESPINFADLTDGSHVARLSLLPLLLVYAQRA